MSTIPEVGSTWAAKGEVRPPRFRTVIAVLPGHEGGIVFYREGETDRWMTAAGWQAWVATNNAAPVVVDADGDPLAAALA